MVLYVDETECPEYFIVAGLLVDNVDCLKLALKKVKNRVSNEPLSNSSKAKIFTEFKSTLIDRNFQRVKKILLEEIGAIDYKVFFSWVGKSGKQFTQKAKERAYINIVSRIATAVPFYTAVLFDGFNKRDFEADIVKKLESLPNIEHALAVDSQREIGIKVVDNICSTIRLHLTSMDQFDYFSYIENHVIEV